MVLIIFCCLLLWLFQFASPFQTLYLQIYVLIWKINCYCMHVGILYTYIFLYIAFESI